jgi:flagella basal body P-ring formation protein FlgA
MLRKTLTLIMLIVMVGPAMAVEESCDQLIVNEIMMMFGLDTESYLIEVLSNHLTSQYMSGCALALKPLTQKDPVGLFSVLATLTKGDEVVATGQVRLRIKKYADVVVANDRITRGDLMVPERLALQRMEITNLIEQPLVSLEALDGFRARRNLRKGTIVTTGALEAIPDIERGKETLIVYDDGLCKVTAPGLALQSGLSGEYIKVKNKATNKIVVARIVDNNSVAVDP